MFASSIPSLAGRLQAVGDPDATRTIYTIVIVLLVIGVVLIGVGVWVIRQTRSDPELLAPLEQMDTRAWRKRDPVGRQRMLDDVRPDGASPVRAAPDEPDVDDDFELPEKRVPTFDDLEAVARGDEMVESDGADDEASDDSADGPVEEDLDVADEHEATGEPDDGPPDVEHGDGADDDRVDDDRADDVAASVAADAEAVESDR